MMTTQITSQNADEIVAAQRRLIAAHTERRIVEAAIEQASHKIAAAFAGKR